MGFTKSYAGLIVARCFLGLFEGGLLPGIIVYLNFFYRRHELAWRIGLFYCAAPLSGAFGGLLATGLAQIRVGGYNRWPWIFFIEGAITTAYGIVCLFFMPHNPGHARFLTNDEKSFVMMRLKEDAHGATDEENVDNEKFDWYVTTSIIFRIAATPVWFHKGSVLSLIAFTDVLTGIGSS